MTERWRCFIAAPIDEGLRRSLAEARAAWLDRPDLAGLRWTDPMRWHLTLAFLGDVDRTHLPVISERVADVAHEVSPRRVPTGGLGGFPSAAAARVAWYGIGDPDGQLAHIAQALAEVLGLARGRDFRPHLTLARARRQPVDLGDWIREAGARAPTAMLAVRSLAVMRSHRGRGDAAYETLAVLPFEGPSS
jgi:2'-5' RNA ligase